MFTRSAARRITSGALLVTASTLALAMPAHASSAIYASDPDVARAAAAGERVTQQGGLTQLRLDNGGTASFVDGASYQLRADGSIDLFKGSVTVAGGAGGPVVVHLAGEGEGRVEGQTAAASFSVDDKGDGKPDVRGHVINGVALIAIGPGSARRFTAGQMWHSAGGRADLAVAIGAAAVPDGAGTDSGGTGDAPQVAAMGPGGGADGAGGPLAAAVNGVPVVLGDALAAAGASGDIVAAARRVQAAAAAPALETFPSGDLALLVGYAGRLEGVYGGRPFNGAAADIVRTYLQYLANGGSGAQFLTVYAGFMTQYLDLMRSNALPSSFRGASVDQINAFIAYRGRTGGLASLSSQNRVLVDAYLAFIQTGGNADQFVPRYTTLTDAYFAFLRGGGDPLAFQGANQQTINAYLVFLRDSGLLVRLSSQNQALLTAWLNSLGKDGSGFAFADQYRVSLTAYYTFLQSGRLPSTYSAADVAQLRAYLETLQATGLFERVLGAQAQFYAGYLAHLQAGGTMDGYAGLPANIFSGYSSGLTAYYTYLKQGGVPSAYTALSQEQIRVYLAALQSAGAYDRFLGELSPFWGGFYTYLAGGGNPDLYSGLPVPPDYPAFANALNAYAAYLAGGGLPSGYTALSAEKLKIYIDALISAGRLDELLGSNSGLLSGYFTYLGRGGAADSYSGLPVYANYASALSAYYAFLQGGGLPGSYGTLTPAQIQLYIKALIDAGVYNTLLTGDTGSFLNAYYAYIRAGGTVNGYSGLPVYNTYYTQLTAYYTYLAGGGLPSGYSALSQAQIQAYLKALVDAGVFNTLFSGDVKSLLSSYYGFVSGGGVADKYTYLPVYVNYAASLQAYYAYLAGGGLPSGYTALSAAQIQAYLKALTDAGVYGSLVTGDTGTFLSAYYAYLVGGGAPNGYTSLPVYTTYVTSLRAYYVYLQGGGLPSGYTLLTAAQIQAYLKTLTDAGVINTLFSGATLSFLTSYYTYIAAGSTPDKFAALPANAGGSGGTGGTGGTLLTSYTGGFTSGATGGKAFFTSAGNSQPGSGTPVIDDTGALVSAGTSGNVNAKVTDVAGDSRAIIGRYTEGTAKFVGNNVALVANGGMPWVALAPVVGSLPTSGTIDYKVMAATRPVYSNAASAPGTFDAAMTIAFSGSSLPTFRTSGTIVMPESSGTRTYNFTTANYAAGSMQAMSESAGGLILNATMTGNGSGCTGSGCSVIFYGNFGGSNPQERLGLTYQTYGGTLSAGRIQGAVIFAPTTATSGGGGSGGTPTTSAQVTGANMWYFSNAGGRVGNSPTTAIAADGTISSVQNGSTAFAFAAPSVVREIGRVGDVVAWSRWDAATGNVTNPNDHIMVGAPAVSLPTTGKVDYNLIGGTAPTNFNGTNGSAGTFTGALAVQFGTTPKVGLNFDVIVGAKSWRVATSGGAANPTSGGLTLGSDMRFSSTAVGTTGLNTASCVAYCNTGVFGGLFGTGASHAGFAYQITDDTGGQNVVAGTAVFAQTGTPIASIAAAPLPVAASTTAPTGSGMNVLVSGAGPATTVIAGLSQHSNRSVTAQANGKLDLGPDGYARGTAVDVDTGTSGGVIAWTRWQGGASTKTGWITVNYSGNGGASYVWAKTPTAVPTTGTATYQLIGGTRPSLPNGSEALGTIDSASLAVSFATRRVGFTASVSQGGASYTFGTVGGTASPSMGMASDYTFAGQSVNGSGTFNFNGLLGGTGATHAAVAYTSPTAKDLSGVIVFSRDGSTAINVAAAAPTGSGLIDISSGTRAGGTPGITVFNGSVTAQADGKLDVDPRSYGVNTATNVDYGTVGGVLGWSRWEGGATTSAGSNAALVLPANGGLNNIWGKPVTNMPTTGTATYTMAGSTRPTAADGSLAPGKVDSASLAVAFATRKVGLEASITIGGAAHPIRTSGGVAAPSVTIATNGTFTDTPAMGSELAMVSGFLAGDGASHAAVAYMFPALQGLNGVIAFTKAP